MDDISIFQDKAVEPTETNLTEKLGPAFKLWNRLRQLVMEKYPGGLAEWNYSGKKYGWSYRIKDKKRAIIYFLPRDKYFKVAFVFGEKATKAVLDSDIAPSIKKELKQAKKYAEGRGIRIDITSTSIIPDIEKLVEIKLGGG